jgi:hypothetical protein
MKYIFGFVLVFLLLGCSSKNIENLKPNIEKKEVIDKLGQPTKSIITKKAHYLQYDYAQSGFLNLYNQKDPYYVKLVDDKVISSGSFYDIDAFEVYLKSKNKNGIKRYKNNEEFNHKNNSDKIYFSQDLILNFGIGLNFTQIKSDFFIDKSTDTKIDIDDLKLNKIDTNPYIDLSLSYLKHHFSTNYISINQSSKATLSKDYKINNYDYSSGLEVDSKFKISYFEFNYLYLFNHNFAFGLSYDAISYDFEIKENTNFLDEGFKQNFSILAPTVQYRKIVLKDMLFKTKISYIDSGDKSIKDFDISLENKLSFISNSSVDFAINLKNIDFDDNGLVGKLNSNRASILFKKSF